METAAVLPGRPLLSHRRGAPSPSCLQGWRPPLCCSGAHVSPLLSVFFNSWKTDSSEVNLTGLILTFFFFSFSHVFFSFLCFQSCSSLYFPTSSLVAVMLTFISVFLPFLCIPFSVGLFFQFYTFI